jgi:hypothetical protein
MKQTTFGHNTSLQWRFFATACIMALAVGAVHAAVNVDVANMTTPRNSMVRVPISVANVGSEAIVSVEVFMTFDPTKVTYVDLDTTGAMLEDWVLSNGFLASVISSGTGLDTLKVAGATTVDTVAADGVLFNVDFNVGAFYTPMTAALTLEHVLLNAGTPANTPGNGSIKVVGVDGVVVASPAVIGSSQPIQITITEADEDRDAGIAESLTVQVANGAQSETVTVTETAISSGVFVGSIDAVISTGTTSGDGVVQAQIGEQIAVCYDDVLDASGNTVQQCDTVDLILGTLGGIDMTVVTEPADTVRVRVVDPDLNIDPLQADLVHISVKNSTTLEVETIQLNETGADTDIFIGRLFTLFATGAGAVGDSTLNVQQGDLQIGDYLDTAAGTGNAEHLLDTTTTVDPWGDASGNGQLRGFDAAEILSHAVGATTLTGLDSLAANVDDLSPFGPITAFDASLVLQMRVGLIDRFPVQPKTSANHPQPESSVAPKPLTVERRLALVAKQGYWSVFAEDRADIVAGELFVAGFRGRVETADDASGFLVASRYHDEGTQIAFAGTRPLQGSGELLRLYPEKLTTATTVRLIRASFNDGRIEGSSEAPSTQAKPGSFRLLPNVPNPFNPETVIRYELPRTSDIQLTIFNILGQPIRTLLHTTQAAGAYNIRWNGRDDRGRLVAGGLYFYRLKTPYYQAVNKMLLAQ